MRDIRPLLDLLKQVPIHALDLRDAHARGDIDAIRYARAMEEWRARAERMLEAAEEMIPVRPSAYDRAALASELTRL